MSNLAELKELMSACVEIGFIKAHVTMSPSTDKIRKKEAEALLVRNGLPKVLLSRWVGQGLVAEHKGEKNSPIWYSLMSIMEMIVVVRSNNCLTL